MQVIECLGNDRYRVKDMTGTRRVTRQSRYEQVVATDSMKPYRDGGGVSESEEDVPSDEDGVVLPPDSDSD